MTFGSDNIGFKQASAIAIGLLLSISTSVTSDETNRGNLNLQIETQDTKGTVMIAVYADEETYSGGAPVAARQIPVSDTRMSIIFGELPYGTYAIKAFHDRDGNGKLTTNPFGAPIEPYAFSNGAKAHYGPPEFEAAAFEIAAPNHTDTLSFLP